MSQHAAEHVHPSETIGRPQSAAAQPLTRRRVAALLALAPAGMLLAACATAKPSGDREHRPTYKNGQRGSGGSGRG
jgi:hypothetical protein